MTLDQTVVDFWEHEIRPRFPERALNASVTLRDGRVVRYINLDNAATTKPFKAVKERIDRELDEYGSVHRGAGQHSVATTERYERAREFIRNYVDASRQNYVIFTGNTTEAINHAAALWCNVSGRVLISDTEHSSNLLPWLDLSIQLSDGTPPHITTRFSEGKLSFTLRDGIHSRVLWYPTDALGRVDMSTIEKILKEHQPQRPPHDTYQRIKLITVTGASNVTGYKPPIYEIAELAHRYGAKILVDVCQLMAHERVDMLPDDDPRHLDFIVFSAHKLYAPLGVGVLIGPKYFFDASVPYQIGGGSIPYITHDLEVKRFHTVRTHEAGSPNAIGVFALEEALKQLGEIGMERVQVYEHALVNYVFNELRAIPHVCVYIPEAYGSVIPFDIEGMPAEIVAERLAQEYGIGTRAGSFCTYELLRKFKGVTPEQDETIAAEIHGGITTTRPSIVRASFSIYNQPEDAERFVEAVREITIEI